MIASAFALGLALGGSMVWFVSRAPTPTSKERVTLDNREIAQAIARGKR